MQRVGVMCVEGGGYGGWCGFGGGVLIRLLTGSGFGCGIPFRLLVQFQVWDMGDCRTD
ncbi:hypothetical protein [Paenibacillus odorifer]|uniref:hypothetical protein n=1 Tax=Paenibacillus odorifer TaxID=189426 RepID=UPI001588EAA2|nr:hypothetical protein [Paenibacillus odorifer]